MTADNHHIALLHKSPTERAQYLAHYFQTGLEQHELCIYVSAMPEDQAIAALQEGGLDIADALHRGDIRLFDANSTYLPTSRFVADYMLANVTTFLEEAQKLGYSGLRTAGEMDWIKAHSHAHDEAAYYESSINQLEGAINFVGVCTYASTDLDDSIMQDVLETHPEITHDYTSFRNPYYGVALTA